MHSGIGRTWKFSLVLLNHQRRERFQNPVYLRLDTFNSAVYISAFDEKSRLIKCVFVFSPTKKSIPIGFIQFLPQQIVHASTLIWQFSQQLLFFDELIANVKYMFWITGTMSKDLLNEDQFGLGWLWSW